MPMTASERTLRARVAVQTRLANEDPKDMTAEARKGFLNKFLAEVPEQIEGFEGEALKAERLRRARALRTAHMNRLRLKQAQGRRAAAEAAAELAGLDGDGGE